MAVAVGGSAGAGISIGVSLARNVIDGVARAEMAGANIQVLNDVQIWVLSFAMLLGRLELLTVLVLFTGHFWRK